jgi:hypothetical protein
MGVLFYHLVQALSNVMLQVKNQVTIFVD